jgi:ribosomal protein S18 acetylase RimI-like enzyme
LPELSAASRPYAGVADLRHIQRLVARSYASTGLRVGDIAWLSRYHTHRELAYAIRLWEDDAGQVVGWIYYRARGGFNLFVAPGHTDDALLDQMLGGILEIAAASQASGDPPVRLYTYGVDVRRSDEDRAIAGALERHRFQIVPTMGGVMTRSLDEIAEPRLPAGYRFGWVETRDLMLGRVLAHQAAFAPSDLIVERYERVQARWPYRPELDRIVLTGQGEVVAFCTAWTDEENRAGLLEPVGTHPAHQRRGLASEVCLDALRVLRGAWARMAQVGFGSEAGQATYQSIGFELAAADTVYRRNPR